MITTEDLPKIISIACSIGIIVIALIKGEMLLLVGILGWACCLLRDIASLIDNRR
jgi:hypothetical protein